MIYLILLFSFNPKAFDIKDIERYSPHEREEITIELIRQKKYDTALSFSPDKNLTGCIKILKDELSEGMEDIKESATKGNIFSLDLYLLFNLKVSNTDLKNYIIKELKVFPDTSFSYQSPYIRYLALPAESLYVQNAPSDSVLYPYIILKVGMMSLGKNPEETKKYFRILIEDYPNSLPTILARNTMRALEKIR